LIVPFILLPSLPPLFIDDILLSIYRTKEELEEATLSAKEAFQKWKEVPVQQRQRVMFQYQSIIREHLEDLAKLITLENGKTLQDSQGDVFRGLEVVETACMVGNEMKGETLNQISKGMDIVTLRQPLGVCAGITPFNFPAMIPLWMFPIACTTGNTFVLKPSPHTPGASMLLAKLSQEAGLPPGVLNVVHGSVEVVNFLCDSPHIRAISFVGGNAAGESIHARGTANGKRVQANTSAKNHATILPDADREATIKGVFFVFDPSPRSIFSPIFLDA
jgi:malonate-semialdehyde dehydrogenase (acetylating)/methylmalonate-semialdehyde dehydrogenase